ncbi:MAG: hypothetical protein NTU97_00990 [Candidatus Magasanikbacteria bacterium]|nr:hypothetical protein [Candidatus Magasanikbacteria bacterium]
MKGEKGEKMGLRTKRLIYELSLNQGFNKFIQEVRKTLKIPDCGFKNDDEFQKWLSVNKDGGMQLLAFNFELQKQFSIPIIYKTVLDQYLIFGPNHISSRRDPKIVIDDVPENKPTKGTLDELYKKMNLPFSKIYILGGSTCEQVVDEIRNRWDEIENVLGRQEHNPQRVMNEDEDIKKRDALIYDLYLQSRKELGMKKGDYKDIEIARIIKEKHDIHIGSDSVKTIIKNQRKLRLGKFKFKF